MLSNWWMFLPGHIVMSYSINIYMYHTKTFQNLESSLRTLIVAMSDKVVRQTMG